jgi:hypothetical protein
MLPLGRLTPADFERLCLHFTLKQFPDNPYARLHGVPGQNQSGYDLVALRRGAGTAAEMQRVFAECKRIASLGPSEIRGIVERFLRDNEVAPGDAFWVFASADLSRHECDVRQIVEDYAARIPIRVFDLHALSTAFFDAPHAYGYLVELFWGQDAALAFYGGVDWHEKQLAQYRATDPYCKAIDNERLYPFLQSLYPEYPLLAWQGNPSPVTVLEEANERSANDLQGPLGDLVVPTRLPDGLAYPDEYDPAGVCRFLELCALHERRPKQIFNGLVYSVGRMSRRSDGGDARLRIDSGIGRYFNNVASSHSLEDEIVSASLQNSGLLSVEHLPRRSWLHERVSDPVIDGGHRCAAIGGSTLVVYANEKGSYSMIVRERSPQIVAHPFRYHVVPSFMVAPLLGDACLAQEFDFDLNLRREYLEELYREEDLEVGEGQLDPRFFCSNRALRKLDELLHDGRAQLLYTGTVVNLLYLRPEICTLLLIRDPQWWREEGTMSAGRFLRFNPHEFLMELETVPGDVRLNRKLTVRIDLDARLRPVDVGLLARANMVPPAIGAIHLGLRAARRLLGLREHG